MKVIVTKIQLLLVVSEFKQNILQFFVQKDKLENKIKYK